DGIRERLLPAKPELFVAAANRLFPRPQEFEKRKPFLAQALALWNRSEPTDGPTLRQQALVQAALNRPDDALASYAAALKREPRQTAWRLEYARLLRDNGKLAAAQAELRILSKTAGDSAEVRDLLEVIDRELFL